MSGGHYGYQYQRINYLIDEIELGLRNDFKTNIDTEYMSDYLSGIDEETKLKFRKKVKKLVKDLKSCSIRAKELEWFMSGDTSIKDFLEC